MSDGKSGHNPQLDAHRWGQPGAPVPSDILEQLDQDIAASGGEWQEPEEYLGAVGRTMFDLPTSEDNTVTVLLPREEIGRVPSQSIVRVRSVGDGRVYLGIVVKGPFAEPDGLRGDAPIVITTAVRGGIFMPRYHGRVQVELIGEQVDGVIVPPRLRPLPNSPVFILDLGETVDILRLDGDVTLGVPVGYEQLTASVPSNKKSVLPRHLGILGTTGGGKSTTVSGLIAGFQGAGLATVVLDTEGEYTQIYQPTPDPTMLTSLAKRGLKARGVEGVRVYHLHGRATTCPDRRRVTSFSLQFSQLSPYLVMEILDLNEAQTQRYGKAYDITKRLLRQLNIFPANAEEREELLELDEMETGYPRMTAAHMYDVVKTCVEVVSGEEGDGRFFSPDFKQASAEVVKAVKAADLPRHIGSWRVVQGRLSQLLRLHIFDNPTAGPLDYASLTQPGAVSIIDLSDTDSPQINNLVIAELLRGLQGAQNDNYRRSEHGGEQRRLMIIVEEAHEFLSDERIKQMPVLFQQVARIARRGRKRWLGLCFVTQLPQHLPDEVLGLINNY
ncbi:MAG: hypothetical protein QOH93_304, partial [Chloroflexia bacterium]|nr:hypothetical protein [Chloroflexia bacterium]